MEILPLGLGERHVPYDEAWQLQRALHEQRVGGARGDTVVYVEHEAVYTAGRRTATWDRPTDGTPVVDVDRGGRITWHGPGQLVGYPIIRLAQPIDVVRYVRALEDAVMGVCAEYGLDTVRVEDRSGVWLPASATARARKICAIGVRVAKGVTMHGFALNCEPDLAEFNRIVPCGISDADVTSLTQELGRRVTIADVTHRMTAHLTTALAPVRWEYQASTDPSTAPDHGTAPHKETV
ncbi:lipoyl(octanoyl) transferase LipB [Demequina globuliformis]|uniref:lipoyl(octanoyl) transferase LipB n=1 Tax=Demequina globuliformis TaxID=676202 RepID=UPI0007803679|nr:lipoyl(octanoyl) transferase LipB [Demequina globuliformis]